MRVRTPSITAALILPRWRIYRRDEIALGPGKAELLSMLQSTGSLAEAAQRLEMSYMRAWKLVQTMNRSFREPLVALSRGGRRGGQADLTPAGRQILAAYKRLETESLRATKSSRRKIVELLRP